MCRAGLTTTSSTASWERTRVTDLTSVMWVMAAPPSLLPQQLKLRPIRCLCLCRSQVQGMSFIAAVLILNLEEAEAFITFANLLNKPCQMAFFRVDHELVKTPTLYHPSLLLFSLSFLLFFPFLTSSYPPFRCWSISEPLRFSSRRIFLSSSVTSRATTWLLTSIWSIGERSLWSILILFPCFLAVEAAGRLIRYLLWLGKWSMSLIADLVLQDLHALQQVPPPGCGVPCLGCVLSRWRGVSLPYGFGNSSSVWGGSAADGLYSHRSVPEPPAGWLADTHPLRRHGQHPNGQQEPPLGAGGCDTRRQSHGLSSKILTINVSSGVFCTHEERK